MSGHYYACSALNWAVADTRAGAIAKVAKDAGFRIIRMAIEKNDQPGLYVWSCYVDLPIQSEYEIQYFKPVDVPIADGQEHAVTNVKGTYFPWPQTVPHV